MQATRDLLWRMVVPRKLFGSLVLILVLQKTLFTAYFLGGFTSVTFFESRLATILRIFCALLAVFEFLSDFLPFLISVATAKVYLVLVA